MLRNVKATFVKVDFKKAPVHIYTNRSETYKHEFYGTIVLRVIYRFVSIFGRAIWPECMHRKTNQNQIPNFDEHFYLLQSEDFFLIFCILESTYFSSVS